MRRGQAPASTIIRVIAVVFGLSITALANPQISAQQRAAGRLPAQAQMRAQAMTQAQPLPCPPSPSNAAGKNFQGRNLAFANFSRTDLTNANFRGATLQGTSFIGAKLTGADFSGATIVATGSVAATDFSFANLDSTCFIGAKFSAPTYFTYATLTCADFSQTDIGNAIFGDQALRYDASASCRTAFRQTTMSCEFVDDWRAFDLTGAVLSACATQLVGRNFSGARMAGVKLPDAVLDGTSFAGADLSTAILDGASLQCLTASNGAARCVDLSNAKLQGASLNRVNLSGASLYHAFLSNNVNNNISDSASLRQAHLKNVNLAFAELSGVDFSLANFYGNTPANNSNRCATTAPNDAGFTLGCASAHAANLAGTIFESAYLYGVDFTAATISGVSFNQAVLSGANFAGAQIGNFTPSGSKTKFTRAFLQGTNLDQATTLANADLTDAFVDFRSGGNLIYVLLNGVNHNAFACSNPSTCKPLSGQDVCVWVRYPLTTVPTANTTITCPDGKPAGTGCGVASPGAANPRWRSSLIPGTPPDPGPPPGWYVNDPTYPRPTSDSSVICGGLSKNPRVINW